MAKAAAERATIRKSLEGMKGQTDSNAVICLAYYSGMNHSVDHVAIQKSYRDSGLIAEYEKMGLDPSNVIPRENTRYDQIKYGLIEFVNNFNSQAAKSGSKTRMKHIHIGKKPIPHNPSVNATVKGIVTYEKDSEMSPTQVNTIWAGDDGSLSFTSVMHESEIRDCIVEQVNKVNPANWRQSVRNFLERHGGLKQTSDGAGGGNRWMPVQTSGLLDMMDQAVEPHGGRLTWFGIPSNTSERHKEGIIDSLMDDIDERLDNVEERLNHYAEKINDGEPVKGSALLTAKEDAATVNEIMALHGANFGLEFVEIRERAKDLMDRADDLHSSAVSKSKAEVQKARKKAGGMEPEIKVKAPESAKEEIDWSIDDAVDCDIGDSDEANESDDWDFDDSEEDGSDDLIDW